MSIYPNTLEAVTGPQVNQILSEMEDIFPPLTVGLNEPHGSIMYRAGQRSVVDWLVNRINQET